MGQAIRRCSGYQFAAVGAPHGRDPTGVSGATATFALKSIAPTGRSYGGFALTIKVIVHK
jgi:hypothetical protein